MADDAQTFRITCGHNVKLAIILDLCTQIHDLSVYLSCTCHTC